MALTSAVQRNLGRGVAAFSIEDVAGSALLVIVAVGEVIDVFMMISPFAFAMR